MKKNFLSLSIVLFASLLINLSAVYAVLLTGKDASNSQGELYKQKIQKVQTTQKK